MFFFLSSSSGSHFLLDLPVYCGKQDAAEQMTNRAVCTGAEMAATQLSRGGVNDGGYDMTSSLLLGSLSPYLSADDSIDGLLLPDVEEGFSHPCLTPSMKQCCGYDLFIFFCRAGASRILRICPVKKKPCNDKNFNSFLTNKMSNVQLIPFLLTI